jgi:gamma-glutamyltranspeptidase/glutathione hydrolase
VRGAVAAGHPLTAAAGAEILTEGGNAVDACVAAGLASWVVESPLTGPGGGGFMLVHRARDATSRLLDFFVSAPGLGRRRRQVADMEEVDVDFAGGETTQAFRIGAASCAVPGTAAGLAEAHRLYGSLPWARLVEPAIALARDGFELTRSQAYLHAILDVILRHSEEGRRVYGRSGGRLAAGDRLRLPELAGSLEAIAGRGAAVLYGGELGDEIVRHLEQEGGAVTRRDLRAYRVVRRRPVRARFRGRELLSNPPPSSGGVLIAYGLALLDRAAPRGSGAAGSAQAIAHLVEVMREQARARGGTFVGALHRGGLASRLLAEGSLEAGAARLRSRIASSAEPAALSGTTHVSVLDGAGNAASLSASTGSGSGVLVPGTGISLNNMLGEPDLNAGGALRPGTRLTSMMAPSIVLEERRPRLVLGSAGSARLRGAIMQVVVNVLEHERRVDEAIELPRVHLEEPHVHCEGGHDPAELDRLEALGYEVVRWRRRNLYFGGVSAVEAREGELAAAGDPRRGGHGVVVRG